MPRFAANLTLLFTEHAPADRPAAARAAGFDAVEVLDPYALPAAVWRDALDAAGLQMALINTPAPDWAAGDRGRAAVPGATDRFRRDFDTALRYAAATRARHIHVMSGQASGPRARATLIANLDWAASQASGQSLTIEPLNPQDAPGYFLNGFGQARDILAELARPNLSLQFDCWHAHRLGHDPLALWRDMQGAVRHIQIAGIPGRSDPPGSYDYAAFFAALDRAGYGGVVSGEYHPKGATADGLSWIRQPGRLQGGAGFARSR